jgi:DHA2 family multidrug resistance protein-like MFS transporter
MDAYGFFIAGFLITMGTLGDRIGRRRLLMIGMIAFAVVSVIAAFAPAAWWLIIARAGLGVAGATLMPSTLSLISNLFGDVRQRALAIGIWVTMFGLGMAAGPVVGGALVAASWWGAVFLIAVPVAAVVLIGAPLLLPEFRSRAGRLDLISVGLSLGAMLPIIYAIKHTAAYGVDLQVLAAIVIGGGSSVAFVRRQLRLPDPLLDLRLFTSGTFSAALGVLLVGLAGFGGVMYLVTQYLQLVEGLSPTTAGLWMGPPALAMLVGALGAPLLAARISPGVIMAGTLATSLLGYGLLAVAGPDSRPNLIIGFAIVYLGLGVIAALGTDIVVGAAPPERSGSAGALSETVQELGIATGVAILGSLTTAIYRTGVQPPPGLTAAAEESYRDGLAGALALAGQVPDAALDQARAAFTSGLNLAAVVAGIAVAIAALVCFLLLRRLRPLGADEQGADEHEADEREAEPVASTSGNRDDR